MQAAYVCELGFVDVADLIPGEVDYLQKRPVAPLQVDHSTCIQLVIGCIKAHLQRLSSSSFGQLARCR